MSDSTIKLVAEKYKKKFDMNLPSFYQFLTTKVFLDSYQTNIIMEYLREKNEQEIFNDEQLIFHLNVIAAVQSNQKISQMDKKDIKNFTKITFLGKKKKKSKVNIAEEYMNYSQQYLQEENPPKTQQSFRYQQEKGKFEPNEDRQPKNESQTFQKYKPMQNSRSSPSNIKNFYEQTGQFMRDFGKQKMNEENNYEVVEGANKNQIVIQKHEKMGQEHLNPVIKYEINYNNEFVTWRRFSEIQKLMNYLHKKYQGFVLPEMPPKEGIKGGITNLWGGVDEEFLLERQEKLQLMLNRLIQSKFVSDDQVLQKFLKEQEYEIDYQTEDNSYMKTLTGLTQIVFNPKEATDYGVAYFNYMWQYRNQSLNSEVSEYFSGIRQLIQCIQETDRHRRKINQNFHRRREIMEIVLTKEKKQNMKEIVKTDFDKVLETTVIQSNELIAEYNKYVQLKSTENWLKYLIKQKNQIGTKSLITLQNDEKKLKERIVKMENNLMKSMKQFKVSKENLHKMIGEKMILWRTLVHP